MLGEQQGCRDSLALPAVRQRGARFQIGDGEAGHEREARERIPVIRNRSSCVVDLRAVRHDRAQTIAEDPSQRGDEVLELSRAASRDVGTRVRRHTRILGYAPGQRMLIVDGQVHIWEADRPDRPWPPGRAAQAQKPYPVTKEMVLAAMDEAGVDRAVLIPPSWEGDYNDLVLEAAQSHPDRFGAMGRLAVEKAESRD